MATVVNTNGSFSKVNLDSLKFNDKNQKYVRVTIANNQSIPTGVQTQVLFDTILSGELEGTDIVNSLWVCPQSGIYNIYAKLVYANAASGVRSCLVLKGDSVEDSGFILEHNCTTPSPFGVSIAMVNFTDFITKGQFFEIDAYQNTGGPVNLTKNFSEDLYTELKITQLF
jgi:hypothetical protein